MTASTTTTSGISLIIPSGDDFSEQNMKEKLILKKKKYCSMVMSPYLVVPGHLDPLPGLQEQLQQ